jgi:radical SAM protein with 4Fe4S-binding SPASM domain
MERKMNKIRKHITFKLISIVLIIAFLNLDITLANPFVEKAEALAVWSALPAGNITVRSLSEVFAYKNISDHQIADVREKLLEYCSINRLTIDAQQLNNAIRIAHRLYQDPSIYSQELCREIDVTRDELKEGYSLIRKVPIFHATLLNSKKVKLIDTIMFQFNDRRGLSEIVNGKWSSPKEIDLHLSAQCQKRCIHCYNEGKPNDHVPGSPLSNDYEEIEKLLFQIKEEGAELVNFSGGGEPSLCRRLSEALRYAHSIGLKCRLFTNGIDLKDEVLEALLYIENVKVSLDAATPETFAKVSGLGTDIGGRSFKKILSNIQKLINMRKDKKSPVKIKLGFVATSVNYKEILDFLDMAIELGVDRVDINYDYLEKYTFDVGQLEELNGIIEEAKRRTEAGKYPGCKILFSDIFLSSGKKKEATKVSRKPGLCRAYRHKIAIDPNGNVYPCCLYVQPKFFDPKYVVGNVRESSFSDILKRLKEVKIHTEQCKHCQQMDIINNVIFEKFENDFKFGILVADQPFVSQIEYQQMKEDVADPSPRKSIRSLFNSAFVVELLKRNGASEVAQASEILRDTGKQYGHISFTHMFSDKSITIEFSREGQAGKKVHLRCYNPKTAKPTKNSDNSHVTFEIIINKVLHIEIIESNIPDENEKQDKWNSRINDYHSCMSKGLSVLEEMNIEFQRTRIPEKGMIMLIPSNMISMSQRGWMNQLNRFSKKSGRKEKLRIVDTDNLSAEQVTKKIIEEIKFYQSKKYKVVTAVKSMKEAEVMRGAETPSLIFTEETDLYFIMTCLRALHRKRMDLLVKLYQMYTGKKVMGELVDLDNSDAIMEIVKMIVFTLPESKRIGYDLELINNQQKIKNFILSA